VVTVVTDSCASLPPSMVQELGIEVVPYHVHTVRGTLLDGVGMSPDEFYAWLRTTPDWPTTANPSAGEFLEAFRRAAERGNGVVSVNMTGTASGGVQSAILAKRLLEKEMPDFPVEVVDTQQVAMAHGWPVIQAARAALKGLPVAEVAAIARNTAASAFVGFTNDTLEYLRRGGRINKVAGTIGDWLNIMPIIGMRDGMPASLGVARTRQRAWLARANAPTSGSSRWRSPRFPKAAPFAWRSCTLPPAKKSRYFVACWKSITRSSSGSSPSYPPRWECIAGRAQSAFRSSPTRSPRFALNTQHAATGALCASLSLSTHSSNRIESTG